MANLDVGAERQTGTQGSTASSPLEIPPDSSSPTHSPNNSPKPPPRKEANRSDRSRTREISPSQLEKPENDTQVRNQIFAV